MHKTYQINLQTENIFYIIEFINKIYIK